MKEKDYKVSDFMDDFRKLNSLTMVIHSLQHYEEIFNNIKYQYDKLYEENIELRKKLLESQNKCIFLLMEKHETV